MFKRYIFFIFHLLILVLVSISIVAEHNWNDITIGGLISSLFFSILLLLGFLGLLGHIKVLRKGKDLFRN